MTAVQLLDVQALVEAAARAPSSHNTQPWLFRFAGDVVELYADRTRGLPVNDPADRELTISCGAALFNLCVVAEAAGRPAAVRILPNGADDDLLAVVRLGGGGSGNALAPLVGAIDARRTYRGRFAATPLSQELRAQLDAVATAHGTGWRWVPRGPERQRLAELIDEGDRAQFGDASWRRELASWMHSRSRGDGLTVPSLAAPATRLVVTHFDLGVRTGAKDAALVCEAPAVGVLVTTGDTPADWLTAGQALQHLLLVAAAGGVLGGFANQPCQVPRLRPRLAEVVALSGHPQVVLRLGIPSRVPSASPRRPATDVFESQYGESDPGASHDRERIPWGRRRK